MVEVDDVRDQLGRRNPDFAADEDIDTLHGGVFDELLDQVFSDCAGGADNDGFHTYITSSLGFTGSIRW